MERQALPRIDAMSRANTASCNDYVSLFVAVCFVLQVGDIEPTSVLNPCVIFGKCPAKESAFDAV